MVYLVFWTAVVVYDADTAAQGHRYGHIGLGHCVHRGGHKGGPQGYFLFHIRAAHDNITKQQATNCRIFYGTTKIQYR
jgi:hypothetical protein